jgi:uncharacterized protein YcgL (UPF0745 family)
MTDNPLLYREVVVYRSAKKADTYLYLPAESELTDLPAELNQLFGRAILAMELVITPELKMSRLKAADGFGRIGRTRLSIAVAATE